MPWFKVDDDLAFHQKTVKAGNSAMGLWVRAGAWCAQQLTDGFIPDSMIELIGTPAQRRKLIAAALWVEVDGGCMFHGWNKNGRQPTSQSVREKRSNAARRQQEYRDKLQRNAQVNASRNGATNASVTDEVTPVFTGYPTRPDPSTSYEVLEDLPAADASGRAELALVPPQPDSTITAKDCTAAFVDAFRATGAQPADRQIKQAARESKQLIDAGNDPAVVLDLARAAGSKRRATVVNEMSYRAPASKQARPSTSTKIADLQAMKTGTDDRPTRTLPPGGYR